MSHARRTVKKIKTDLTSDDAMAAQRSEAFGPVETAGTPVKRS